MTNENHTRYQCQLCGEFFHKLNTVPGRAGQTFLMIPAHTSPSTGFRCLESNQWWIAHLHAFSDDVLPDDLFRAYGIDNRLDTVKDFLISTEVIL